MTTFDDNSQPYSGFWRAFPRLLGPWLTGLALVVLPLAPNRAATAQQAAASGCEQSWPLRRGMLMYTHGPLPKEFLDRIADRFEFSVAGYRPDLQYMLDRNSKFKWVALYNSLTDNYLVGSEHDWLMANASRFGVSPEDIYLHFLEDTVLELEGQQITIPGWNPNPSVGDAPASATSRDQARVPVYFANLSRRVANFSTPGLRDLNIAFNLDLLSEPLVGGHFPGGIMFDNSMHLSLRASPRSGGRIAEDPGHSVLNSDEFLDWYWMNGVRVFLADFTRYLDENSGQFGGRRIHIMPNVANAPYIGNSSWERSYVEQPVADILMLEFEYNPTRNVGMDLPKIIFDKHTQALNAGVGLFETGYLLKARGGLNGSFTDEEATMNTLAGHWVHRADDQGLDATTYLLGANVWDAETNREQFELNLAAAFDVDLGRPLGAPFVLQSGTDPQGNAYKVYGRRFHCGLAIVRHRAPWDGHFDESTAVEVELDGAFTPISLTGLVDRPVTTWSLRNGEGQIFMSSGLVPDSVPPGSPRNLRTGG